MHAVGIHSAMAIKRQRKRRDEQKRARERRYSTQSSESGETFHSPSGSFRRKFHQGHTAVKPGPGLDSQVTHIRYQYFNSLKILTFYIRAFIM